MKYHHAFVRLLAAVGSPSGAGARSGLAPSSNDGAIFAGYCLGCASWPTVPPAARTTAEAGSAETTLALPSPGVRHPHFPALRVHSQPSDAAAAQRPTLLLRLAPPPAASPKQRDPPASKAVEAPAGLRGRESNNAPAVRPAREQQRQQSQQSAAGPALFLLWGVAALAALVKLWDEAASTKQRGKGKKMTRELSIEFEGFEMELGQLDIGLAPTVDSECSVAEDSTIASAASPRDGGCTGESTPIAKRVRFADEKAACPRTPELEHDLFLAAQTMRCG